MKRTEILLVVAIALLFCVECAKLITRSDVTTVEAFDTSELTKTVAHVNGAVVDQHKLIYSDTSKDVAFYEMSGSYNFVSVGDKVYIRGIECEVIATDIYGFTLKENFEIQVGYSGSAVITADDIQVGYVSERLPDNRIFCIWS